MEHRRNDCSRFSLDLKPSALHFSQQRDVSFLKRALSFALSICVVPVANRKTLLKVFQRLCTNNHHLNIMAQSEEFAMNTADELFGSDDEIPGCVLEENLASTVPRMCEIPLFPRLVMPDPRGTGVPGLAVIRGFLGPQEQNDLLRWLVSRFGLGTESVTLQDPSPAHTSSPSKCINQGIVHGALPPCVERIAQQARLYGNELFPGDMATRQPLFDHMLCNHYLPGEGIPDHVDLKR